MAQHDYDIGNQNGQNFRTDVNNVLDAIQTTNSGSSEPATKVAYMLWADTTNNLLKVRNGANNAWISLGSINTTNLGLAGLASPTFTGTVTAPELDLTGNTSLKLPVGTTAQRPTGATGDIRFNSTLSKVETYTGSVWESVGGVPAGSVTCFAHSSVPSGWLECNGANVSRSTYATLFAAIGTTWGTGDGSSTFGLPDGRGEWVRGWDNSRGVDSGRSIATTQSDQNKAHTHTTNSTSKTLTGYFPNGPHGSLNQHTSGIFTESSSSFNEDTDQGSSGRRTTIDATHTHGTDSNGGTEVRVRNIAMMYIIKY